MESPTDKLCATMDNLPTAALCLSAEGVVRVANRAACALLGGRSLEGLRANEILPGLAEKVAALGAEDEVVFEQILDGGARALHVRLKFGAEAPAGRQAIVLLEDRTEERRSRAELVALQRTFQTLVEGQGVGIGFVDPQERFVYANATARELFFGASPGTLVGEAIWRFVDEAGRAEVQEQTRMRIDGDGSTYSLEITRADGERRRIQITAAPSRDASGEWEGTAGVFRDVTEQHLAERALEASERRNRAIVAALPDVVLHLSRSGRLLDLHAALHAELQAPLRQPLGTELPEAWPREPAAWLRGALARTLSGAGVQMGELRCEGPEGGRFWEARAAAVSDDEVMLFLRDTTLRRRMQERLEAADRMASVGTLAAGVSHFINNPLASIMANLEFMTSELEEARPALAPTRAAELFEVLAEQRTCAERIKRIVADLRTLAQPGAAADDRTDLPRAIELAVGMVGNELRHRAELVLEVDEVPPVLGRPAQVGQVCMALLINAMQAIPEGRSGDRITVRARVEGEVVSLEIADTGTGIPYELQARVFEPFFTTKFAGETTGLGLSVSHNIIQGLGGSISLQSEPGRGTTVTVRIPVAEARVAAPAERPAHILVVDDEEIVAASLKRALRPHTVETCFDGREAARRFVEGDFDLMLCDVMMPGFGGQQVFEDVRALSAGRESKIVFMTGGAFSPGARRFIEGTSCRWVEKPFDLDALRRIATEMARGADPSR